MENIKFNRLSQLFLLITAVGVVHMGEQITFGIEEFHMLRGLMGSWQGLFPMGMEDHASVMMITIVFATVSLMIYGVLRGGRSALGVILAFGLLGVGEAHHWLQSLAEQRYDPGLVTSIPFVYVGYLIVRECLAQMKSLVRAEYAA